MDEPDWPWVEPVMTEWQPIETAPKDGTVIIGLGFPPKAVVNQRYFGADVRTIRAWTKGGSVGWSARNNFGCFTVGFDPPRWMPLPASNASH